MIAVLMVASVSAYAQNDDLKNEIGVFYGFESASSYSSIISGAFVSAFSSSSRGGKWGPIGMFQGTGIGIEAGGEAIRAFAELGFGEKGTLCAGLRYKF